MPLSDPANALSTRRDPIRRPRDPFAELASPQGHGNNIGQRGKMVEQ